MANPPDRGKLVTANKTSDRISNKRGRTTHKSPNSELDVAAGILGEPSEPSPPLAHVAEKCFERDVKREDPDAHELNPTWAPPWTDAGVIEVLQPLVTEQRRQRIGEVADGRLSSVTIVLDAPHDPHNGAAVIRSCDAFGVARLHVVERVEPFLISKRIACGADRWVDVVRYSDPTQVATALRHDGFRLVATRADGQLNPDELSQVPKLALILGNEHDGICAPLLNAADASVRIPMRGFVESLNLSVSAAILIQAATRARAGDLSSKERRHFYARALYATVPRSAEVLAASVPR